jgi:hypothetical protein
MAASSDGNFTKQNGDFDLSATNSRLRNRPAYARTVGNYPQVNTLKDGQSCDFCKAECLMDLCESDHVLHFETEQSSNCGDP